MTNRPCFFWGKIPKIGSGGFGSAYKVEFDRKGCHGTYVLKSAKSSEKSLVEAQLGETIEPGQPGLVPTFTHVELPRTWAGENCIFMLMEHASTGELKSKLGGKLTHKSKITIFYEMLQGLLVLHERGIIHRDLKPQNVFLAFGKTGMFSGRYHPFIGDFGLACCQTSNGCPLKRQDPNSQWYFGPRVPKCKGIPGTLGYISPATFGKWEASPDDDLWAMGKILLQMLRDSKALTFTDAEMRNPLSYDRREYAKALAKYAGRSMMSDDMARELKLKEDSPLYILLEYLLCNGCKYKHKGAEATLHAIKLTEAWMKDENVQVKKSKLKRPSESDVRRCLGDKLSLYGP